MEDNIYDPTTDQVPIILLASLGQITAVKELIETGADVNEKDELGRCAIITAASRNDLDMVDLLIKAGAKVDVKDGFGRTPLGYAQYHKNNKLIELIQNGLRNEKGRGNN
mgnify:CR=1 FL=1